MNINELMIGDLVKLKPIYAERNGIYQKIVAINSIDNTVSFINKDGELVEVGLCCIEPIPLSEEMLIENGFSKEEEIEHCEYGIGDSYTIDNEKGYVEIYFRDSFETMTSAGTITFEHSVVYVLIANNGCSYESTIFGKPFYVHEIQHAFSLCGLGELVDKIIIKQDKL